MCIEKNKCLNMFSMQTAVFLIAVASCVEGLTYYLLNQIPMILFAVIDLTIFVIYIALNKTRPILKKVTVLAYPATNILQLVAWVIFLNQTFYVKFEGRKKCEAGLANSSG